MVFPQYWGEKPKCGWASSMHLVLHMLSHLILTAILKEWFPPYCRWELLTSKKCNSIPPKQQQINVGNILLQDFCIEHNSFPPCYHGHHPKVKIAQWGYICLLFLTATHPDVFPQEDVSTLLYDIILRYILANFSFYLFLYKIYSVSGHIYADVNGAFHGSHLLLLLYVFLLLFFPFRNKFLLTQPSEQIFSAWHDIYTYMFFK